MARAIQANVCKLYSLPQETISDRYIQFTIDFKIARWKLLKIEISKSTTYHPHIVGQTESVIQVIEAYLPDFVNYDQDDWYDVRPLPEFPNNNGEASATKLTPFFANHGLHPLTTWAIDVDTKYSAFKLNSHCMQGITEYTMENLKDIPNYRTRYFDKRDLPELEFKVGDLIMLNARNIKSKRPIEKSAPKSYDTVPVMRFGTHTCTFDIENCYNIFPVFQLSLLEPSCKIIWDSLEHERPPPDDIAGEIKYEVQGIVRSEKTIRGKRVRQIVEMFYLMTWFGCPNDECSWEPAQNLAAAQKVLKKFHLDNPRKPKAWRNYELHNEIGAALLIW